MSSVFERTLPHENLNKLINAAMRSAGMLPSEDRNAESAELLAQPIAR